MKIIIKKGLDIPLAGKPNGDLRILSSPQKIALNIDLFEEIRFKVLAKQGENVKIGQPLLENKSIPGQMFVSPASGVISEIRRGTKRRLLDIVINIDSHEVFEQHRPLDIKKSSRDEIMQFFMRVGILPHIRLRPFNLVPDPQYIPRDIFITAVETRPFCPPYELHVDGNDELFQAGLDALSKLTPGKVHLVYPEKTTCKAFTQAQHVERHTARGPHPAGMSSVHIHHIAPIRHANDFVWSLSAIDTLRIGKMVIEGRYLIEHIVSIAGNGILENERGFFKARMGYPIEDLIKNRLSNQYIRLISGDPLTGVQVEQENFLGFNHTCFSAIPENTHREAFHFLRPGFEKYSATKTYLTGHFPPPSEGYSFTTNMHGEERPFIDGDIYEGIMPMRIPTMHLIKAILSEDYELAEQLGLLEVTSDDFALPTFICPSKIEMVEIVKQGLSRYAKEMGH